MGEKIGSIAFKYFPLSHRNFIRSFTFFLFLITFHVITSAQENNGLLSQHGIDSLKNVLKTEKEDTNKINTLNNLSYGLMDGSKYSQADSLARLALSLSQKLNFARGTSVAYGNIGLIYNNEGNFPEALKAQSQSLDVAQKSDYKQGISNAYKNIGSIYSNQGDYPEALKNYSLGLKVMEDIGDKRGVGYVYLDIGIINSAQGNYVEASTNLLKSLKILDELGDKDAMASVYLSLGGIHAMQGSFPEALKDYSRAKELGGKQVIKKVYGNMGFIYARQRNFREAIENETECLKLSEETNDKYDMSKAYVNIGNIYTDSGNYKEALVNYQEGLKVGVGIGDMHGVAVAYIDIGANLVSQKRYPQAIIYLDSAVSLAKNIDAKDVIRDAYSGLSDIGDSTHDYKKAYYDYQQYIIYRDSVLNKEDIKKITKMEAKYEFDKREDSIKAEQERTDIVKTSEIKRKSLITYSMVVILLLSLISATLLISRQQIKHKKDKIIFEKNLVLSENENNLLKLERQQMEDELASSKAMLDDFTRNMVEKNELLEQFKHDFEELKKIKSKEIDEKRIEDIEYLNKTTILTEDDWDKFKELFEQVHKGFFVRLKEKLRDLTNAEIRLICLTKLKLDTKEMAGILGVSFATIRQSRYRLRKKIGLLEEDTIDDIVESI